MKRFTQAEFSASIVFSNPAASETATVNGLVSKHSLGIDSETGLPVNSKNTHISVAESVLNDEEYTTRDSEDRISLKNHKVVWVDASGTSYEYLINETMPSNTFGLIVCTLGDLNDG